MQGHYNAAAERDKGVSMVLTLRQRREKNIIDRTIIPYARFLCNARLVRLRKSAVFTFSLRGFRVLSLLFLYLRHLPRAFLEKPQAAKSFFFVHLLSNGKVFVKILLRNVYTSCKKYCIIRAEVMYDIT